MNEQFFTIDNGIVKATFSNVGATQCSVVRDGVEYMWQGDERYWTGTAPRLFPICGRLYNGEYLLDGKMYPLKIHGFLRDMLFDTEVVSSSEIIMTATATAETLVVYPFNFKVQFRFYLDGDKLITETSVSNEGAGEMPFSIGSHPGFNVPLVNGITFDDYYLQIEGIGHIERIMSADSKLITHNTVTLPIGEGGKLPIDKSWFDNDTLIFNNAPSAISLISDKDSHGIRYSFSRPYLFIWQFKSPDTPYLCLEPWTSLPSYDNEVDDLRKKPHNISLKHNEVYTDKEIMQFLA